MSINLSNYERLTDNELKHFNWREPNTMERLAISKVDFKESLALQVFKSIMFGLMLIVCLFGFNVVLDYMITLFDFTNIVSMLIYATLAVFLAFVCFMLGYTIVNETLFKLESQINKAIKNRDFEVMDTEVLGCYEDTYTDGDNNTVSKMYTVVEVDLGKVYLTANSYCPVKFDKSVLVKVPIKTLFNKKFPVYTYFVVSY